MAEGWRAALAGLSVLAIGAAACSPAPEPGASDPRAGFYEQDFEWEECGGDFECAAFQVPVDYDAPGGERLEIAVMRLPARSPDPVGSLIVNPGGPGGSGTDYVRSAGGTISERVREDFHVVGFDPRGVGDSRPIRCLEAEELDDYVAAEIEVAEEGSGELSPESLAEVERLGKEFAEACADRAGELLAHIGTADVARDMDVLRELAGDERLTYLGKSYGTYIGAHYAQRFPERVRAMVLDGAVDPELSALEMSVQQAEGFDTALRAFVADCHTRPGCPLRSGDAAADSAEAVDEGVDHIAELIEDARERPLADRSGEDREVNGARVQIGILAALYSEHLWPAVREALGDAFDEGDGTALLHLGDRLYERDSPEDYENRTAVLLAVNCRDHPAPRDVSEYEAAAERAAEVSPVFGPSQVWGSLVCAQWPVPAAEQPDFSAPGAEPVLVVGTLRDSATPYRWSERLAETLDSGVLLTYDGDGHTAYGTGSACVDEAVDTYLTAAEPPGEGTVCGG